MRGIRKSAYKQLITDLYRLKWKDETLEFGDIMRKMYVEDKMSMQDMADELNVAIGTVHNWIKKEGISARKMVWL